MTTHGDVMKAQQQTRERIHKFLEDNGFFNPEKNGYHYTVGDHMEWVHHEVGIPFLEEPYVFLAVMSRGDEGETSRRWVLITPSKVVLLEIASPYQRNAWVVKKTHDYQSQSDLLQLLRQLAEQDAGELPNVGCWGGG